MVDMSAGKVATIVQNTCTDIMIMDMVYNTTVCCQWAETDNVVNINGCQYDC